MAWMDIHFYSRILGIESGMYVLIPEADRLKNSKEYARDGKVRLPVLYLLHGTSQDHTDWLRRTSLERYVEDIPLIVVMPAVRRSYYSNQKTGYNYFDFLTEELPDIVQSYFPASERREDTYIAGLSMGGYGAMKAAFAKPKLYAAAASLSGMLDFRADDYTAYFHLIGDEEALLKLKEDNYYEYRRVMDHVMDWGTIDDFNGSDNDLNAWPKRAAERGGVLPRLYLTIGRQDEIYHTNPPFIRKLKEAGIDFTYDEREGEHNWEFWDKAILRVLKWFGLKDGRKPYL